MDSYPKRTLLVLVAASLSLASCSSHSSEQHDTSDFDADVISDIDDLAARFTGLISGTIVSGGLEPVVLAENAADDDTPAEIAQLARIYEIEISTSAGPRAPAAGETVTLNIQVPIPSQAGQLGIDPFELPVLGPATELTALVAFDERLDMWSAGNGRTIAIPSPTPALAALLAALAELPSPNDLSALEPLLSKPLIEQRGNDSQEPEIEGAPPTTRG